MPPGQRTCDTPASMSRIMFCSSTLLEGFDQVLCAIGQDPLIAPLTAPLLGHPHRSTYKCLSSSGCFSVPILVT